MEIIQDGSGCHLELIRIENSVIRSAVPENPTLEPNMKWIGSPVAEMWPFAYVGGIWNPHFGEREGLRGLAMAPLERAMVLSYRLSIVTVALSVTIRPHLRSNVSDAQINRGWVTLGQNLGVLPLEQTRHVGVAKSEHPNLTNGEIIFEQFPSQSTNVTDGRTDGQTDGQTHRRHAIAIPRFAIKCIARRDHRVLSGALNLTARRTISVDIEVDRTGDADELLHQ